MQCLFIGAKHRHWDWGNEGSPHTFLSTAITDVITRRLSFEVFSFMPLFLCLVRIMLRSRRRITRANARAFRPVRISQRTIKPIRKSLLPNSFITPVLLFHLIKGHTNIPRCWWVSPVLRTKRSVCFLPILYGSNDLVFQEAT